MADPHVDILKEIMSDAYEAHTGFKCRIDMKSSKLGATDSEERLSMIDYMYETEEEELGDIAAASHLGWRKKSKICNKRW